MPQHPLPSKNRSWNRPRAVVAACLSSAIALLGAGCSPKAGGYYLTRAQAHEPSDAIVPANPGPPRSFAMFEGDTGRVAAWHDLIEGVAWAVVVLVGEGHVHRAAHLFQLALGEDRRAGCPGTAVSLEMLERDEQELVDRYLRGELPLETFVAETESANWAGKPKEGTPPGQGTWEDFYQPMIDAAKRSNARVIAANAPRDYVRRARLEGYDALRALPAEERALFDLPVKLEEGDYFERFVGVMSSSDEERSDPEARARIRRTYQSQQVWDATAHAGPRRPGRAGGFARAARRGSRPRRHRGLRGALRTTGFRAISRGGASSGRLRSGRSSRASRSSSSRAASGALR